MKLMLLIALVGSALAQSTPDRVALKLDASEADAVLAILDAQAQHRGIDDAAWQRLFGSRGYQRLKQREASMHRDFTDDEFRRFVLSPDLAARRAALASTLAHWKAADLARAGSKILPYLPATARVHGTVYPVIKPQTNSFVFEASSDDPAIFLYLDPQVSERQFENTVAHESHHLGLENAQQEYNQVLKTATGPRKQVLKWIGAFGEGLAVLAAAGSTKVHPMADFSDADRVRWGQDMKYADRELAELDQFFQDILAGGFTSDEISNHVAYTFFGYRGPWYVVGYRMAAVVEDHFGRAALLEGITDPRQLLLRYNEAAAELNRSAKPGNKLALWDEKVIAALQ